mmetsp:Transcript_9291/g.16746  ORF Transcript_9291/g.16746 Transcript_9291/m.16746 type:complete len:167 (-) Transcript_9291:69-569(-)
MVFTHLLIVTLASLGSCSRLTERDSMEPGVEGAVATEMLAELSSNDSDTADSEWGKTCCCYQPMYNTFTKYNDGDHWIGPDSRVNSKCPAIGCLAPPLGDYYSACNKNFLNPADIWCKITGKFGCNEKTKLQDEVPQSWKDCYGQKPNGMPSDCMLTNPIKAKARG